jgi:quinol monooxygenase YgiN
LAKAVRKRTRSGEEFDGVIRSVLYLEPKDGDYEAVVDFYRREDVLGRAARQPGCLGSELHVPTGGRGPILVTALWTDPEAYEGWVSSPVRAAGSAELAELVQGLDEKTRGETYTVVISSGEPTAPPAEGAE